MLAVARWDAQFRGLVWTIRARVLGVNFADGDLFERFIKASADGPRPRLGVSAPIGCSWCLRRASPVHGGLNTAARRNHAPDLAGKGLRASRTPSNGTFGLGQRSTISRFWAARQGAHSRVTARFPLVPTGPTRKAAEQIPNAPDPEDH